MAIIIDPEETEIAILLDFAGDLTGKRILEIGSGDGRLTRRFAHLAGTVVALEPALEKHNKAVNDLPASLLDKVTHLNLDLEGFAEDWQAGARSAPFDLAILSWSL